MAAPWKKGEGPPSFEWKEELNRLGPMFSTALATGAFVYEKIDLKIKGRKLDLIWARKYSSKNVKSSPMGRGWTHSYHIYIKKQFNQIRLHNGWGGDLLFKWDQGLGAYVNNKALMKGVKNPNNTYTFYFPDQGTWNFYALNGSPMQGMISSIEDRNGNVISLDYNTQGQLIKIIGTAGRQTSVVYNTDGFITSVTDFSGRVVTYDYYKAGDANGSRGDLKSATGPMLGKTYVYTYSKGSGDLRLNHNLLTIIDPMGQTFLTNTYSPVTQGGKLEFDRLKTQVWGYPGDRLDAVYESVSPALSNQFAVLKAIVNDRLGNVSEYFYNSKNLCVMQREYAGRAPNPDSPTSGASNRPTGKLRPSDPDYFETQYSWTREDLISCIRFPELNETRFSYDTSNSEPLSRGNLLKRTRIPGPLGGDQSLIEEFFEYDPLINHNHNLVTSHKDPRNNTTHHTYDVKGNLIQTQHPLAPIVEDWEYNAHGQVTAHIYPDNGSSHRQRDEFAYDGFGYMTEHNRDAAGLQLKTLYANDPMGNAVTITDPNGKDMELAYNPLDQVIQAKSQELVPGVRYQLDFTYDLNGNLKQADVKNMDVDQDVNDHKVHSNAALTTLYDYNILNKVTRITREVSPTENAVEEYDYDDNQNLSTFRYGEAVSGGAPFNTVDKEYDERNLLFKVIRAKGHGDQATDQYNYNKNKKLNKLLQGLGASPRQTNWEYDGYDRLVRRTDAMGNVSEHHYDANSNLLSQKVEGELVDIPGLGSNVRLSEVQYEYDALNRKTQEERKHFDPMTQTPINDGSQTLKFLYSDNSKVVGLRDDNNKLYTKTYDTANRLLTLTDPKSNTITYVYDNNSNIITKTEIDLSDLGAPNEVFVTQYVYDSLGRMLEKIDNLGNKMEYGWDSRHNLTLMFDAMRPLPTDHGNRVRHSYDGLNRLKRKERFLTHDGTGAGTPMGSIVTEFDWDNSSRLISKKDGENNITLYEYDNLNRRNRVQFADAAFFTYVYDAHDNPISITDPNGSVQTLSYYKSNRLKQRSIVLGTHVLGTTLETFKYNGLGLAVSGQDNDSLVTREHDSLGNITQEAINGEVTGMSYDSMGNLLQCDYPGGRQAIYAYDDLNRISLVSDLSGPLGQFFYRGPHRVERRMLVNNVETRYLYDDLRRPLKVTHTFDPGGADLVRDNRSFLWNQMSNKIQQKNLLNNTVLDYLFDSIYQMVQSDKNLGQVLIQYILDKAGNRTQVIGGTDPGYYAINNMNQYLTTPMDTRLYDQNGNLRFINKTLPTQRALRYDFRNQMVRHVNASTSKRTDYVYDAFGRLISKTRDVTGTPMTRHFLYEHHRIIEEQDETHSVKASYVHGNHGTLSMKRGSNKYFYSTDGMDNVTLITDPLGAPVERMAYQDFAEPSFFTGAGAPIPNSAIHNPHLFGGSFWRYDPETGFYFAGARPMEPRTGRRTTMVKWGDLGGWYTAFDNNPWSNKPQSHWTQWITSYYYHDQSPGQWGGGENTFTNLYSINDDPPGVRPQWPDWPKPQPPPPPDPKPEPTPIPFDPRSWLNGESSQNTITYMVSDDPPGVRPEWPDWPKIPRVPEEPDPDPNPGPPKTNDTAEAEGF